MVNLSLGKELALGTSNKERMSGDEEGSPHPRDVHMTLELIEVGALIVNLLLELGEPIAGHG